MGRMKNFLIVPTVMVVLFAAVDCFALFGSGAELDVSHINKDLIGKEVDGAQWTESPSERIVLDDPILFNESDSPPR